MAITFSSLLFLRCQGNAAGRLCDCVLTQRDIGTCWRLLQIRFYVACGNLLFHLLQLFKGLIWKSFGKDPYLQTEAIKTCSSLEEMSFLIISFKLLRLWKFTDWIDFLKKINFNFKRFKHKVKEESIISFVKQSKKQLMKFLVFRPFGLNVNYGMWLWYVGE